MKAALSTAPRPLPIAPLILAGGVSLLATAVVLDSARTEYIAIALLVVSVVVGWHRTLLTLPSLLTVMLLVILFIPVNRYGLPAELPFYIEPYRVVAAVILGGWVAALLIDPRVKLRKSGFEGPLALMVFATLMSEIANPGRAAELSSNVVKALTFFLTFVLFVYLVVSVLRTRAAVDRVVKLLAGGGAVIGILAVLERWSGFSVFDHLHTVIPVLEYEPAKEELRNGLIRAAGSAGHPIELAVVMATLTPLALYLALDRKQPIWWAATVALLMGNLASGSRTGVIGMLAVGAVFLWLRPRETLRLWPLLIPAVVVMQIAVPGALGSIKSSFFPEGGLIAEQQHVVRNAEATSNNRIADWGPAMAELADYNPLFGQGYGTRITGLGTPGMNAAILDNQWLKTMLETGLVGLFAWLWIVGRAIRRLGARAKRDRASPSSLLPVAIAASIACYALCMFTYDAFSFIQGTFLLYTLIALAAGMLYATRERPRPRIDIVRW